LNLDEVDQQHPLALVVVLMDIQNNVVHPLVLTSVFEVQQQPEYNLFVLMVNLINKRNSLSIILYKHKTKSSCKSMEIGQKKKKKLTVYINDS
jgi:hypothetical protein